GRGLCACADVLVPVLGPGRFHYGFPPDRLYRMMFGHRVLVPFGPRRMTGFIRALAHTPPEGASTRCPTCSLSCSSGGTA
ncbi:MAG: hypothetical protein AAFV29_07680, partial [Myxococcota bacterium]